ncbi:UNVERIFIED_CONTAM: hypothetical protein PYX00_010995 [Menopon gallinae]|uniref:ABC transporter domain-containing protein n=1 Tax=Menopon gallinae TaxID=328185 RepID=A0AAW2H709_9NEOP
MIPALIAGKFEKKRALSLLERVGLLERVHHYPHQLSGGEQQRVALARSLINQPALLLADEPTGNLDAENALQVQKLLCHLQKEQGLTLVVVTHDQKWAQSADKRYRLEETQLLSY